MINVNFSGKNVTVRFPNGRIVMHDGEAAIELESPHNPETKSSSVSAHNVIAAAWVISYGHPRKHTSDGTEMSVSRDAFIDALSFVEKMQAPVKMSAPRAGVSLVRLNPALAKRISQKRINIRRQGLNAAVSE